MTTSRAPLADPGPRCDMIDDGASLRDCILDEAHPPKLAGYEEPGYARLQMLIQHGETCTLSGRRHYHGDGPDRTGFCTEAVTHTF